MAECKATEKCDALKELEKRVDDHDDRLAKGDTSFAVVNVKLNLILGVLSAVGAALAGVLLKMVF
ncbi:MAG: hypothetical protein IJM21_12655 [Clostridia bacterium]|nr:hypothetical protein [Clostridia bacterium]